MNHAETVGAGPHSDAETGAQTIKKLGGLWSPSRATQEATQDTSAPSPADRRTSLTGLSVAVRDVRIRLAREDIYAALGPVSRHSEAALLCLEVDDDAGLEHHLRPLFELFPELDRGADLRDALERFARVASLAGFITECGADRLPQLGVVGG
jgi:hypothetical protein